VFRLADELALRGWVNNSTAGVCVEVDGPKAKLEEFLIRLELEKPPRSFIQNLETAWLDAAGYTGFEIRESDATGTKTALVLPDLAVCADCLAELFDPANRRHLYPFINCTNCGPRFSIIESLPYDRPNTSMKRFRMCADCQAEYDNPRDRRFHAQPNACPVCGPRLELWNSQGQVLVGSEEPSGGKREITSSIGPPGEGSLESNAGEAVRLTVAAIRAGEVAAVKGLGGFHLLVAAANEDGVRKLRERKHREEKPFALMFPSLESVRAVCEVSRLEERLLKSAEAPIVLLRRSHPETKLISPSIAPGNPNLGVMLPYTPLHHVLLSCLQYPVVATSGNLSDEPICIDEHEACERLKGIADLFLVHNRPIVRHVDDSIVRIMAGREMVLRRARGYAPLPVRVESLKGRREGNAILDSNRQGASIRNQTAPPAANPVPEQTDILLATGGHLKNTIALAVGPQVFISQHIGDLETAQAYHAFQRAIADLQQLYEAPATRVVADSHPDYTSTRFALGVGLPCSRVQHHVAHVLACMAENELEPPALGVSWDGTGYGLDGTVWGGEFFAIGNDGYKRVAHFRQFRLPGGERAIKEPRRSALGVLFDTLGSDAFARSGLATLRAFSSIETATLARVLERSLNSPLTSSVGRLFDAVASLVGIRQRVRFEGQAAMDLEFLIPNGADVTEYPLAFEEKSEHCEIDWRPAIRALLADLESGTQAPAISARFHNTLSAAVVQIARRVGSEKVVLSGGCFQNRYLTERVIGQLRTEGFRPYWHQRLPPNDGGICVGQVVARRWWSV
jgi:hydrogenase maturation protein HypF